MDTKTKWKAGCGVAAVFGAGFLCGAAALFLVIARIVPLSEGWKDDESKAFVTKHLARQLDLTESQFAEIKPIVHEALDRRYQQRRTFLEADIELTGTTLERVLPLLTDPQKAKAEKMFGNWKRAKERFTAMGD